MNAVRVALCVGTVLGLVAGNFAALAGQRQPAPLRVADLPGTYELVDRVLVDGKVLRRPDIAGLYTFGHDRANLNLFIRNADGTLASESSIIRYTLSDTQYCEWIFSKVYWMICYSFSIEVLEYIIPKNINILWINSDKRISGKLFTSCYTLK